MKGLERAKMGIRFLVFTILVILTHAQAYPESFHKRQGADLKVANYIACLSSSGKARNVPPGCNGIGWGMVDIHNSGKRSIIGKVDEFDYRWPLIISILKERLRPYPREYTDDK